MTVSEPSLRFSSRRPEIFSLCAVSADPAGHSISIERTGRVALTASVTLLPSNASIRLASGTIVARRFV